jgi:hypothetical protein
LDQLKVPTRRIEVEVFLVDGARIKGTMFHRDAMYDCGGPADVCHDLNDERAFLPFDTGEEGGGATLLSKRHILRVLVPDFDVEPLEAGQEEQHEDRSMLMLDDGTRTSGRLVLETRLASSRLLDKFNQAPVFVAFVTDQGVELINRAHIVRIFKRD